MRKTKNRIVVLAVAGILALSSPTLAGKPPWAGGGHKGGDDEQGERHHQRHEHGDNDDSRGHDRDDGKTFVYFGGHHREVIRSYYHEEFRTGNCPPGLAKKHNGCMPPGLAKKWRIGRPLPPGTVIYELPPVVITQFGPPPVGYRYVRVDSDILLLAVGTGMVIDALQNLTGN